MKVLRNVGEGRGNLSEERLPLPSPTPHLSPSQDFRLLGRGGEEAMPERISIFPRKENRPRNGTPAARPACPPYFSNRDSINTKVFGKGGMGFGEGREKLFFRKAFPSLPQCVSSTLLPQTFSGPREAEGQHDEGDGHAEHDGGKRVDVRLHAEPHH